MGFLGGGVPLHSRLGDLGERRELRQRGPGRSPSRQSILGIFQGLRMLLVETITTEPINTGRFIPECEKQLAHVPVEDVLDDLRN